MPKLGLGVNLDARASGSTSRAIALYEDSFVAWPTNASGFTTRQFFTSGDSASTSWGSGALLNTTATNNRHILCHFDCLKEKYPSYDATAYNLDAIVYGGIYGHALFKRTSNPGNPGYAPNILAPAGTQDSSGWTRFRPSPRSIRAGETLTISFTFVATSPATFASNSLRFGVFNSGTGQYVNSDNLTLSNTAFVGYKGYMATYGSTLQKIFKKTDTTSASLINTINNATTGLPIWTEQQSWGITTLTADTSYRVTMKISCPTSSPSYLNISSEITGGTLVEKITYTDTTPNTFCFDTFVAYTTATAATALQIDDVKVRFSGKSQNLFLNQIDITGGSFSAANGSYIRNGESGAFSKNTGTTGAIFFGGDGWYIFSTGTGNVARNTSSLGTGTWDSWAPGNSSGITATYQYSY